MWKKSKEVKVGDAFGHFVVLGERGKDMYGRKLYAVQATCGARAVMERYQLVNHPSTKRTPGKVGACKRCRVYPGTRKEA